MKTAEDIESYLLKVGLPYEQMKPGIWVLKVEHCDNFVVSMAGPVVVFRVKVMDLPRADREPLYRTLLSLNTGDMVHGAFGLEGDAVVIVHALDLENLDFNEFQAVIDDVTLAIARHYPVLSRWTPHGVAASGAAHGAAT
jgi:Putative bacterial sensory transduction regulator